MVRVASRERKHLAATDTRLFAEYFTMQRARNLDNYPDEAERVEAFVGRFGRLQDTLGGKLSPAYLAALGEEIGAVVDNLDRSERLGLIPSADGWIAIRKLRNQIVHEYIEDPAVLASALQTGHECVPVLLGMADALISPIDRRDWFH